MKSLTEMNDLVFAQFQRVTGSSDKFQFPGWWAQREREVVHLQYEESKVLAAARWSNLPRVERQRRLLAYLEGLGAKREPVVVRTLHQQVA